MHGGESSRPGRENVVLLEEDFSDGGGIVGGDGVDVAEFQVHEWAVFLTHRCHVAVGEVAELEEVSDDRPPAGTGWEILGICEEF